MKKILNKIMAKIGYYPHNPLKEELYQAAMESYRRNERLTVVSKYYSIQISVVDKFK